MFVTTRYVDLNRFFRTMSFVLVPFLQLWILLLILDAKYFQIERLILYSSYLFAHEKNYKKYGNIFLALLDFSGNPHNIKSFHP